MSLSDGNPAPIRYFLSAGIGGDSAIRADKNDKWGIDWYYVGASDQFGATPQFLFGPRDGTGVGLFYKVPVTRFLNVTPDIKFIRPEASAPDDKTFVYGLRANLSW